MLTHSHVQEIARRIAAAAHSPAKVIVFGSYGRSDATEDSDLDLLVVEREVLDHTAEYLRLREVVGPINVGVDLLLMPQAEFDRRRDWASGPVYWAAREGRVLYDGELAADEARGLLGCVACPPRSQIRPVGRLAQRHKGGVVGSKPTRGTAAEPSAPPA